MNKYFKKNEAEKYVFYKIPKALFTDDKYKSVSTDAKMLYGLLLDRMYLSAKNGWIDKHGRVYQFFTIKQGQELLHFGHDKVIKLFAELETVGLIERKRQGQGKANIIYLKKFWNRLFGFPKVDKTEWSNTKGARYLPAAKKYIYLLNITFSKNRKEFYEKN